MTDKIGAIEQRVRLARKELNAATDALFEAQVEAHPFKIGDIIKSTKGGLARIERFVHFFGGITPIAVAQKKDGTFGVKPVPMWRTEWVNATLHERPGVQP